MSTSDMKKAREWAEWADKKLGVAESHTNALAAARVIQSLPDQWIDAENVREILAEQYMKIEGNDTKWINAATIESLLTPSLPTLADMTPEEREACQWMQAMFTKSDHEHVITCIFANKSRLMRRADGMVFEVPNDEIIPLPDLPKLEWPDSHADTITAESVEDVQAGRVADFEPALPCPEDVPAGEPWIVLCGGRTWVGVRADGQGQIPWGIIRTDGMDYQDVADSEITLVSRLVPEDKP